MRMLAALCLAAIMFQAACAAGKDTRQDQQFQEKISPFLHQHCLHCHNAKKQEGSLDLSGATSVAAIVEHHAVWEIVLQRLEASEMPPAEAQPQPTGEERQNVIRWLRDLQTQEANRNAGDPGIVLARRLNNAEFDYSIRDLTGVDIRPMKEFPVDPANEAGFDNSGESLTMSPALLTKSLAAAKHVADHIVLTPQALVFAPHAAVTETDRDKFCVQRIVNFYERHSVRYADYFLATWKFQHRERFDRTQAELRDFATDAGLSPRYLETIWNTLHQQEIRGPVKELQSEWAKLPTDIRQIDVVRDACTKLSQLVTEIREDLKTPITQLQIEGSSRGSQPLILWWNRQIAGRRMTFPGDGDDAELDAARDRFCRVFPDAFFITSRGHYSNADLGANVRLLSAGFHLMQGYFRDDQPLCELVLSDAERQELDELWDDLNFVTHAPFRQYKDFLFFERAEPPRFAGGPEFDFARPEDKDVTSEEKLSRMRDAYVRKAKENKASEDALNAVETYFQDMSRNFRWIEQTQVAAERYHIESLTRFAEQAWRRPLSDADRDDVLAFYRRLRDSEGLNHEDAIRDSVVSILISPRFSYRFEFASDPSTTSTDSSGIRPLTDFELASRLSYFLWSSIPDDELLAHAAAGDLHDPPVLVAQARRMLEDAKIRGLATEFLGNWLEFRRFEEHNSVDRERFPSFTNELRSAMFEEPVRFFVDLLHRDGSVSELLTSDHTFVNQTLAQHYGMDIPNPADTNHNDLWVRVDHAGTFGRGGLLPMSVFLTKNSPGLRTSPVKRGYWVVRRLLGEHIPAPPPNVPELPKDEAQLGDLTLAEILAKHRDHVACAGCHQRFDAIGLAFEGYGPTGEHRALDLSGHPVQTRAVFPDGTEREDLNGLRRYLVEHRRAEFTHHFVRSMFAYALGRTTLLSDTRAINDAIEDLAKNEGRIGSLIETIVTSQQFLNRR